MISDKLYLEAEQAGIMIYCGKGLQNTKSLSVKSEGDMFIGIDDTAMETSAEERVHLAHELGHCMTGAFYSIYSPIDNRGYMERIANNYAIKKLVDEDELIRVIKEYDGNIQPWELAEHFNVTEEFMHKALEYYFGG